MTFDDVRRIALGLPGAEEGTTYGNAAFKVKKKLFAWERPLRKGDLESLGDAAPDGPVLAVKVEHEGAKRALLESDPDVAFTTPHFDGHPIVLLRLDAVSAADLEEHVTEAWLCAGGRRLVTPN